MVRKMLWCLPKSKWGPNVTAIEEGKDLKTLKLNDLGGKLLNHEIHLLEETKEQAPQQGLALKSTDIKEQPEESTNDEDE